MTQRKLSRSRPDAGFAVVMVLTALCCACTQQQKLTQDSCVVRKSSSFVGTGRSEGQITVAENGDPCGMAFVINERFGGGFVSDPQLVTQPAHGVASARMSNGAAIMIYTPNRDYVGSDRFAVAFGPNYTTTVDVDVVPLP
jgi:hypothetical protein